CNLGNLAVNGSATISLTARANSPGTAITTVRVSGNEGDGDPSNNFIAHVTPVVTPTVAFSNPANLVIADATSTSPGLASIYPSTLQVSGLAGTIYSVTVTLNGVNHGFVSDLDVLLVGPDGQSVMLMSDCGGNSVISGATLTFDDLASLPLPSGG